MKEIIPIKLKLTHQKQSNYQKQSNNQKQKTIFWFIELYLLSNKPTKLSDLLPPLTPKKKIKIEAPKGVYYADPFIIKDSVNNVFYLFFESYDYKKGNISYLTLDKKCPMCGNIK